MAFRPKQFRRGSVRGVIGGFAVLVAAASALAVIPVSSISAQTTAIAADDCDTTSEVDGLTHPGAPVGFKVYPGATEPTAAGRGFQWEFEPFSTPNAAAFTSVDAIDVCNNVASYELWYGITESSLTSLTSAQLAAADPPMTGNVGEIERNMLLGSWGTFSGLQGGIAVNDTYYVMMRVNFQRICDLTVDNTDDPDTMYINERTDVVPAGTETGNTDACDGLRGAWSDVKTVTLPTPGITVSNEIPDLRVVVGRELDYEFPEDTFTSASGTKMSYKAINAVSQGPLSPAIFYEYPGSTGSVISRRFRGHPFDRTGSLTIEVKAFTHYDGEASDRFEVTYFNNDPTVAVSDFSTTVGKYFEHSLAGAVSDPDWHRLDAKLQSSHSWLNLVQTGFNSFKLTGQPTETGSFSFGLSANDDYGGTDTDTFTINVTNTAPAVANQIPDYTRPVGRYFGITLPEDVFEDADGHFLGLEVTQKPDWLRVRGEPLYIRIWAPPHAQQGGTFDITVTADDDYGGTVSDTFQLTVDNNEPWHDPPFSNVDACVLDGNFWTRITPALHFTDEEGGVMTYEVTSIPSWLTAKTTEDSDILFTGDATTQTAGTTGKVIVSATDPHGATGTGSFDITVQAATHRVCTGGL